MPDGEPAPILLKIDSDYDEVDPDSLENRSLEMYVRRNVPFKNDKDLLHVLKKVRGMEVVIDHVDHHNATFGLPSTHTIEYTRKVIYLLFSNDYLRTHDIPSPQYGLKVGSTVVPARILRLLKDIGVIRNHADSMFDIRRYWMYVRSLFNNILEVPDLWETPDGLEPVDLDREITDYHTFGEQELHENRSSVQRSEETKKTTETTKKFSICDKTAEEIHLFLKEVRRTSTSSLKEEKKKEEKKKEERS